MANEVIPVNASIISSRTRQAPWIGVGITGQWDSVPDALKAADLDFEVVSEPAYTDDHVMLTGICANRIVGTGEILGVVSDSRYGIVQNVDAFSLLNPFLGMGGVIEHVGMTDEGMVFMVMRLSTFNSLGNEYELYVCAMNSFNAKFPLAVIVTPVRVICQNMFRKLVKSGDSVIQIKHGKFAKERVLSIAAATTWIDDYTTEFRSALGEANMTVRTGEDIDHFIEVMFPEVPNDDKHPNASKSNERILAMRDEFYSEYYCAPDNNDFSGTRLGLINAYYDWIGHHIPLRHGPMFEASRLGKMINGSAINPKLLAQA